MKQRQRYVGVKSGDRRYCTRRKQEERTRNDHERFTFSTAVSSIAFAVILSDECGGKVAHFLLRQKLFEISEKDGKKQESVEKQKVECLFCVVFGMATLR